MGSFASLPSSGCVNAACTRRLWSIREGTSCTSPARHTPPHYSKASNDFFFFVLLIAAPAVFFSPHAGDWLKQPDQKLSYPIFFLLGLDICRLPCKSLLEDGPAAVSLWSNCITNEWNGDAGTRDAKSFHFPAASHSLTPLLFRKHRRPFPEVEILNLLVIFTAYLQPFRSTVQTIWGLLTQIFVTAALMLTVTSVFCFSLFTADFIPLLLQCGHSIRLNQNRDQADTEGTDRVRNSDWLTVSQVFYRNYQRNSVKL